MRLPEGFAAGTGLRLSGGFNPVPADAVPAVAPGRPALTLLLLGLDGRAGWDRFAASPEAADGGPDPLDRWSARVVGAIAAKAGARALFPFAGPPWLPFQRWAQRAEPVFPSPLGLLIHAESGLWHGYRGALALADVVAVPARPEVDPPCRSCAERPCLFACPVGAFREGAYDVAACAAHIETPAGKACLEEGCRARGACPVGREAAYGPDQIRFHMAAFRAARRRARDSA